MGQGRPSTTNDRHVGAMAWAVVAVASAWSIVPAGFAVAQSGRATRAAVYDDAELTDLEFVDAERGWAVGDRGTILHSSDGGRTWTRQTSGADCRLTAIHFLDAQTGWVAGRFTEPNTHATRGVLLRTRDGGQSWHRDAKLMLPGLSDVGFFDAAHGWAVGDCSALFPSGAAMTDDGGRTWLPSSGARFASWNAASFVDPQTGLLAGRAGELSVVVRRTIGAVETPPLGLRGVARVEHASPTAAWAVAEGAVVLRSDDGGRVWRTALDETTAGGVAAAFDFQAMAVVGNDCWVAGAPGSRVFHTADGGQTWTSHATGQRLPIRSLSFVDQQRGWACGALGTILATHDGGHTWTVVRRASEQVAVLGLYGDASDVPLMTFARLCGEEGYLGAIEILARADVRPDRFATNDPQHRTHEALVAVGASVASVDWRFPARDARLNLPVEPIVAAWDRAVDGRALERIEQYLVREIRTWRPDVILTHGASVGGGDPRGHLINQLVLRAVEAAADEARHRELAATAELAPWQVKKVYGRAAAEQSGTLEVAGTQLAPRTGATFGDAAERAAALLGDDTYDPNASESFRCYIDRIPQGLGQRDFLSGLSASAAGEARRELVDPPHDRAAALGRLAQRKRNLTAILSHSATDPALAARLLAEIDALAAELNAELAAQLVYRLAREYHTAGQAELAAEMFARIAERYPSSELAPAALLWLVRYYSSAETAWRAAREPQEAAQDLVGAARVESPLTVVAPASAIEDLSQDGQPGSTATASATSRKPGATNLAERVQRAQRYAAMLQAASAPLSAEPLAAFPLVAAARHAGQGVVVERVVQGMRIARPDDPWRRAAEGELWLAQRSPKPPLSTWQVVATSEPPYLDGQLDDEVWQTAERVQLTSPIRDDAAWPAEALLARDGEYLYFAVRCCKVEGVSYEERQGPRRRDKDLGAADRVEIALDVDRDRSVAYRLTIDSAGNVEDRVWHDTRWNPTWHLAVAADEATWTCEAAIPWRELVAEPPQPGAAWAAGVVRFVPGRGLQAWTSPAALDLPPESFGLLLFDR